ncbi:hypothetical protein XENOCAPTIV_025663 [Xenoophorus captivus]|uniref:Uncharacterized protein n=1 Tax=Xenoophorus captivus TaxID=1517983 RepID=A0ABV0SBG5_9TELE
MEKIRLDKESGSVYPAFSSDPTNGPLLTEILPPETSNCSTHSHAHVKTLVSADCKTNNLPQQKKRVRTKKSSYLETSIMCENVRRLTAAVMTYIRRQKTQVAL